MPNQIPNPMLTPFYPNECFICKSTKDLRRCGQCQMISYCGETHQKDHWGEHKAVCKIIADILKRKKVSHLFENLRYANQKIWKEERENARRQVQHLLPRPLLEWEYQMLLFPRVCNVCHEAKQQNLVNCPSCPSATFCQDHKGTTRHSINCFQLKTTHDLELALDESTFKSVIATAVLVIDRIFFTSKTQTLPKSMKDLMMHYPQPPVKTPEEYKVYASDLLTVALTLFNALQKAKVPSTSKLIVHVGGVKSQKDNPKFWEIVLHLLPNLKFLKIVIVDDTQHARMESHLCDNCKANNKVVQFETVSLNYKAYLNHKTYEKPNMLLFYNVNPPEERELPKEIWKSSLLAWGSASCPLVLTTVTDAKSKGINEILKSTFARTMIYYDGINEFASLKPKREWELNGIYRENQFMVILDVLSDNNKKNPELNGKIKKTSVHNKEEKEDGIKNTAESETASGQNKVKKAEPVKKVIEEAEKTADSTEKKAEKIQITMEDCSLEDYEDWNYYYSNSCQICHLNLKNMTCSRCKMVMYCEEEHRKEHWPEHKDLCKAILSTLRETGATTLFDKLKTDDMEAWTKAKIGVMLKIQKKIGRSLLHYEKQMFLFPKTCFVCHESDLSVVRTCHCGVTLCKQHKKSIKHNLLCNDFQQAAMLAHIMLLIKPHPSPKIIVDSMTKISMKTIPVQRKTKKLPPSMKEFISSYIKLSKEYIGASGKYRVHITTEFFSRPLTLLYAIQKLNLTSAAHLIIHVIGSTNEEFRFVDYWEVILHWLPNLKQIKVNFVGPEINSITATGILPCKSCESMGKQICIVTKDPTKYHEYYESDRFSKPDLIIGYNLNLHESELGISECTWKETIMTLKKLEAPFILTAETKERAQKDHKRFSSLLEKPASYECFEENPFASLIIERDFETEELKCPNKYIIIYKGLYDESAESDKVKVTSVKKTSPRRNQWKVRQVNGQLEIQLVGDETDKIGKKKSESPVDSSEIKSAAEKKEEDKEAGASVVAIEGENTSVGVFEFKEKSGISTPKLEKEGIFEKGRQMAAFRGLLNPHVKKESESSQVKEKQENESKKKPGNTRSKINLETVRLKVKSENSEKPDEYITVNLELEVEPKVKPEIESKKKSGNTESKRKLENLEKQDKNVKVEEKEDLELKVESKVKPENESERKSENTESKTKLENVESKTKGEKTTVENSKSADEGMLIENLLLTEKKLMDENEKLKRENDKLMEENVKLKQENGRLRTENQLIKDLRSQVQESIREAMSEKK